MIVTARSRLMWSISMEIRLLCCYRLQTGSYDLTETQGPIATTTPHKCQLYTPTRLFISFCGQAGIQLHSSPSFCNNNGRCSEHSPPERLLPSASSDSFSQMKKIRPIVSRMRADLRDLVLYIWSRLSAEGFACAPWTVTTAVPVDSFQPPRYRSVKQKQYPLVPNCCWAIFLTPHLQMNTSDSLHTLCKYTHSWTHSSNTFFGINEMQIITSGAWTQLLYFNQLWAVKTYYRCKLKRQCNLFTSSLPPQNLLYSLLFFTFYA